MELRIFSALLESIFLYNCELWTLTKKLEQKIDTFQRQLLRRILNIRWTLNNWISNKQLLGITNQKPWSETIAKRRMRLFGHICRSSNNTPLKKALNEALRKCKKPRGGQKLTLIKIIENQLKTKKLSFSEALILSQDRKAWRILMC